MDSKNNYRYYNSVYVDNKISKDNKNEMNQRVVKYDFMNNTNMQEYDAYDTNGYLKNDSFAYVNRGYKFDTSYLDSMVYGYDIKDNDNYENNFLDYPAFKNQELSEILNTQQRNTTMPDETGTMTTPGGTGTMQPGTMTTPGGTGTMQPRTTQPGTMTTPGGTGTMQPGTTQPGTMTTPGGTGTMQPRTTQPGTMMTPGGTGTMQPGTTQPRTTMTPGGTEEMTPEEMNMQPGMTQPSGGMNIQPMPGMPNQFNNFNEMQPELNQYQECKGIIYTVKQGDSLYKISRAYGIPLEMLLKMNPITNVYNLQVGMKICVPVNAPSSEGQYMSYVVQQGERLEDILKKFGITLQYLMKYNKNMNLNNIKPGTTIQVPENVQQ
ncbi:LysM peptidoglycan-binding domain-containing protein [Anaeromicropila herbilytica]|uniref:LysM domain-containing protein n=1 Tax=Anaeromicropila herbilytica TaxID=2785025 RepID=A0A7R7EL26_9FIRM|nr:LysM domain-containing protein [Anaeromicropila herbilytica]BCN30452.1 hypothetical protein bsdtb5_17470 [Anaeromicropila herbilytica]